VYIPVALEVE